MSSTAFKYTLKKYPELKEKYHYCGPGNTYNEIIAAIVGYFILGEILSRSTLIAMIIAFIGVCVMIYNDSISGSALGAIIGFISATGFALYSVTIRWKPETPKFTTVVLAGLFCALFSFCVLGFSFKPFNSMPPINSYLSLLHGLIVAIGLILYTMGAKYLPSAELTLLSLIPKSFLIADNGCRGFKKCRNIKCSLSCKK